MAAICFGRGITVYVVDPMTRQALKGSSFLVTIDSRLDPAQVLPSGSSIGCGQTGVLLLAPGESRTIRIQGEPPIRDIEITVTAPRLKRPASDPSAGTTRNKDDIGKFGGSTGNDIRNVTRTTAGVAQDSGGQQHVRGEHTDISYVVDGVPLPDTLSGRQGAIVVPTTIQSVDILLGGFAPEYGGQTAAVLDITTLPRTSKAASELTLLGGGFGSVGGDATLTGPLGDRFGYVVHLSTDRTRSANEPKQPDVQTAHNAGESASLFGKFTWTSGTKDRVNLTVSGNPGVTQLGNRTGLPSSFASSGEGYGFLGRRNADGVRPDANGALGSETLPLPSQQEAGMDINQREQNEFLTLSWQRQLSASSKFVLGVAALHSGQQVTNRNPPVDVLNLPVDSSIEFNPTAARHAHHFQLSGALSHKAGTHSLKAGFLIDFQSGRESYQLIPASQLALDALAATAPNLAPAGHSINEVDINGNPIYVADSGSVPTLRVNRRGHYYAAFIQDTWRPGKRMTVNYGARADAFMQSQDLGQPIVDRFLVSPRFNLSYLAGPGTVLRASYNKLFNTPPLAQGAILGQPLQPPILDQYDLSVERQISKGQTAKLAYYYKQIRNQIDVGLLIPGSEVGLYSGVNLERTGVHGLEFSYEFTSPHPTGWSGFFNYTLSAAKPKGVDNTGAEVEPYNDHDQRQMIGLGLAYAFPGGTSASILIEHGSGLASSVVSPSEHRTPRTTVDLHLSSGDKLFRGRGSIGVDVLNLFDSRTVMNYQSAFSGTRFQPGRKIAVSANFKF